MKIAIMQPYIFPYIGYFQLMNAVDTFVVLDDVNYINRGWINRNKILLNDKEHLFTLPVKSASQNKLINEVEIAADAQWVNKFLKTLRAAYQKAPFGATVFPLIEEILQAPYSKISELLNFSFQKINGYLNIGTSIIATSSVFDVGNETGQNRILKICKSANASHYVNPIGGQAIYSKDLFASNGIHLNFIKPRPLEYKQFNGQFIPWLSIIDVMMFNPPEKIREWLNEYDLV
jgi:hypothetical protein